MKPTLTLIVVLEKPPAGVAFAVQEGHGSSFTLSQYTVSTGEDIRFTIPITLDGGDFRGPFVQGKKGERFVYVSSGTSAGQHDSPWTRRAKIHLRDLPPGVAARGGTVEGRLMATGRDGGPCCATVRLEGDGWAKVL